MNKRITLRDIAGYCPEEAIWRMAADLGQCIKDNSQCPTSPDEVIVDGLSFLIGEKTDERPEFMPPECVNKAPCGQPQQVWTLGALIYHASSGRTLFGGHGGAYQNTHPNVLLPSLQKSHQSLTALMQQCLQHDPSSRISIGKLVDEALKGLEKCRKTTRSHRKAAQDAAATSDKRRKENWPEEMIETI